ncbi:GNAT family N-acetyltransferase [Streptomyces flaveolus]|uniref:GNAT family N-acetyltransferase n=1 Tax=Streptomyces flaveolus TaxID=67297 RepID=UPI0033FDB382
MRVYIDPVATAEVDDSARLIALALRDDPVLYAYLPGEDDRVNRLTGFFGVMLRTGLLQNGAVDVARLAPGGDIIGVAAWEGPDRRHSLWADLKDLARQVRAGRVRHVPSFLAQLAAYEKARPKYPHWYLADIAVSDSARGLGVGSALLGHRLAAVDAQALPAYLEATAPANQRLYERFGFCRAATIETGGAKPVGMIRAGQQRPAR